jgi:hypothetical protein
LITLSIIAYVIISLLIARSKYWEHQDYYAKGTRYYKNGKNSLTYGFLALPVWLVISGSLACIALGVISLLIWIFKNLP